MSKPEQKLQIQVANYCKLRYPHLLWTISPAGLIINRNLGMLSVRLGYRKGTPDLLFFEPRGIFHGLVIELKDINGSVSDDQREFIEEASKRRYATAVCWTYEETIETIDKYLAIENPF